MKSLVFFDKVRRGLALGLCGILLAASACTPPQQETQEAEQPPLPVVAGLVKVKEIPLSHTARGEVLPSNRIVIQAPSEGVVEKVLVDEGQEVTAGTPLVGFGNELAQLKLDLARAEEEEAETILDYENDRYENRDDLLENEEIISPVYELIEKRIVMEQARLKRVRAEVEYYQRISELPDIVTPIAGKIVRKQVVEQMPVAAGQELFEIVQDNPLKVQLRLPEEFLSATYTGQLLKINFPSLEREVILEVNDVGVAIDPLTQTFQIAASLDNSEGEFRAGMPAEATLTTDKTLKLLFIPQTAPKLLDRRTVVYKVVQGRAVPAYVRLGKAVGDDVTVRSGLESGDIIILDPPPDLQSGRLVEVITDGLEKNIVNQ